VVTQKSAPKTNVILSRVGRGFRRATL
jgi:hypothetical protein